jgi:hypothetical protein
MILFNINILHHALFLNDILQNLTKKKGQTVKLYRKLDVLSELEYTLNFHFNLDSDTDPKLHPWYTWRDYPLHWYMRWRNKWKKNCDILPFFFDVYSSSLRTSNFLYSFTVWCISIQIYRWLLQYFSVITKDCRKS